MQNAETGDEIERMIGKGHLPTAFGPHVFERGIMELACGFENGYPLGAAQDRSQFISIGAPDTQDMLEGTVGEMAKPVPPIARMVRIQPWLTLFGQPVIGLCFVAKPSLDLIGREIISEKSFAIRVLFETGSHCDPQLIAPTPLLS
jgi:hypothetical protein